MNIRKWLLALWGLQRTRRGISAMNARIDQLLEEKAASERELQQERKNLLAIQTEFAESSKKATQAIDRATGLNRQMEAALAAAREELDTATKITIPGLVAANQLFVDRWQAESQIVVLRAGAAASAQQRE